MLKGFHQVIVLLLLVAFTGIYLNGTRIFTPPEPNSPYLSNLRYDGAENEWHHSLFGEHGRWASMENYIRLRNEYESKRAYGLLNDTDEVRYHRAFRDLARNALNDWRSYQTSTVRERLAKNADLIPNWYEIRTSKSAPVVVAGILAAAYTGRTLRYRLSDRLAVESRTILGTAGLESQYVGWSNSLLGASLGSTYEGGNRGVGMSMSKDVGAGVTVNYARQLDTSAVTMVYSTGF